MFDPQPQHFYSNSLATQKNNDYDKLVNRDICTRVKDAAHNHEYYDLNFIKAQNTNDESGVNYSPRLWKSSTKSNNDGNLLSPNSRTRAIAKGQQELKEMAKSMPESCYELTFRDMVKSSILETPKLNNDEESFLVNEKKDEGSMSKKEIVERQESKKVGKNIERVKSENYENGGLFLKMAFPTFMRSKGKKKLAKSNGSRTTNASSEISKSITSTEISHNNRKAKMCSSRCCSFA